MRLYNRRKFNAFIIFVFIILIVLATAVIPKYIKNNLSSLGIIQTSDSSSQLKVHFINVGQADSILVQQGNKFMLIDAGNNADSNFVKNYLDTERVSELEVVVGTHPHEDHIGGMAYIINSFKVGKIYLPEVTANTQTFKDMIMAVKNKGMIATKPTVGESFNIGEAKCTIVAPNKTGYDDLNNYSIVIKVSFGNNSFLLTGDAESISETEILEKGLNVKADVIKLGHHGSSSSTTDNFLKAVNPKYAVISVGSENKYGHPSKTTMDKLKAKGINIYRTDESGTIVASSDGKNITFKVSERK